ncbi:carboxypeptidase-like regulatory domain-containing protein [Flaviramulus sp. BrNp1-15]|uniref:alpha-2-macroglobulin family protein n=1 Tax=Flaviramulus sp. BrNp1-15 TaxID=2916754 RepID=UPI001EE7A2AF|nr:MG2 domain-containing protein [Flaviramulus sp. BrNp1-15]ULC60202.1 carboxypeptidase-like regulatory domain-containing protein [Flaviramulus sp. BrNp1-15]
MKQIFSILMIILFANFSNAQTTNYDDLWTKVEQLEIEGLPASALKIVEDIAQKATKDNNHPQLIKTMLFKSKFALVLQEDAQLNIINDFKKQIELSEFPTKNVLESILANLYWQYFNQNRWKFYNRTKTSEKVDPSTSSGQVEDFRTWDLQTLFNEINLHYQNSLLNGLMLQQEDLSDFDALLNLQKDSKIYRPTLFDFISHNALEFYKTNETHITKPAYKFELDNPDYLSDAKTFSTLKIESKDSTALQLHALKIYQNLIQFHLKDDKPFALADVNIERLKFVNQHATFNDKERLLLNALKTESEHLKTHEISGLYDFEIASVYYQQSNQYQPKTNEDFRWKAKEAVGICNAVIKTYSKSKGAEKCKVLKSQIEQQILQITTEDFLPIQKNARLLVRYKNLNALQFHTYKLLEKDYEKFNKIYRKEEQLAFIKKLKTSETWESNLKNEGDYQTHTTEVILPKLNNGRYLIVSHLDEENFAFATIQVTNLALVETETPEHKIFQIINRNNGNPIENAKVELSYYENNNKNSRKENFTTDAFGQIKIKKNKDRYRNITTKVTYGNDTAYFGDYYLSPYYQTEKEEDTNYKAFIFTDRSIYRPGQTVYFKAIAMKTNPDSYRGGKSEVLANEPVYATLYNTNDDEIAELEFTTNAFGSVAGEFILPNNGLNGQYYIEFDGDEEDLFTEHYFSVEEYKRPKFETKFTPVTETFKINDSVTVKGNALAYAGSNITDAKVVYRVHRKVQYPRWYFWYRPWFNSEPQEITHGATTTNDKGEFEITFKAIPDQSINKSSLPIFNYEITADVTDLNGETRSATTIVNVGYHALTANMSIDGILDKTKKDHKINITTENLNGEFVPAKGTIKMYKLKAPNYVLRPRPWAAPDYQDLSKEAFKELFPYDAYSDEHNPENWNKGELVLEKDFNTEKSKNLALGKVKKWQSGIYLITLESKDKFGQLVKDQIKTTLFSENDKTLADKQLFNITTDKSSYNIGDNAVITLASAAQNIAITLSIEKDKKAIRKDIIQLNNNKKTISIPVTKNDLGGFVVNYSFAAFNSFQSGTLSINVPYPKTNLEIETVTFRDKLQPGTDETWSFKIKGPQGEKVSAELLASMYDASLDQFIPHSWSFNPIEHPAYYSNSYSRANSSFGTRSFRIYQDRFRVNYPQQHYDQLNWFGFSFNFNKWRYDNYKKSLRLKTESKYDDLIKKGFVSGTVFDSHGNPLPGVNVIIKGTTRGTTTDFDGNFSIEADKGDVLSFSFIGYTSSEHKVDNNNSLSLSLVEDSSQLDEVVVSAMGIKREKSEITYSSKRATNGTANLMLYDVPEEEMALDEETIETINKEKPNFDNIQIRKNLQETSFFFPQLQTDATGNVSFSFTTPEALTQWKLQLLAHTKTLESATKTLTTVTQKELMVIPNTPRFFRHGDNITISTKIANLTEKQLSGNAYLILTDAITGEEITNKLVRLSAVETFLVEPKNNTQVSWNLSIPEDVDAVQYKIIAKSEDFSDGEQNALPVLSNRMLVTETLPMWIKSNEIRTFTLDKLKTNTSTTLKHHKLTLEITSNPAWYAVQALPYLMEFPYECNEQTFSRYYANALASHIANSNPRIQEVFNQWKSQDVLISNLEKNEELKSILIQETPWLRDAQSETEQKKRIALLFDLNKMNNELESAFKKLENNQMESGAWSWFNGGRENRYITQHIITGFGHLSILGVTSSAVETSQMIEKAIKYLDSQFIKEYKDIRKYDAKVDLNKDHLSYTQLHYLYMRSFFPEIEKSKEVQDVITYYQTQIQKYWLSRSLYAKGLMALVSHRNKDSKTASKILKSLKETSITSEELGMYWKENTNSWFWYQAPIETQALLIEAFSEIENDTKTIDNLKIWLLKNKQTNRWKTTKATTEAVYALLLQGSDWLSVTDMVDVLLGGQQIEPSKLENVKVEAGTGYYKTSWNPSEIKPEMAEVKLTKKGDGIAWGSLYWQYFEDLDKIYAHENGHLKKTSLYLEKKLFLKTNTDTGEEISEITNSTKLKVGDLVRVRIELRSDRNMEFLHMKDMRASGLEPVNVLSQYKWQDGLGYYESTKDASTNFFFDYLPKGVYVFEYDLRVNNAGNMSNGITTIQSMYAPEFSSHSEGVRINVE